jgi:hypothetical protein
LSETAEELAENGNRAYLTKIDRSAIKARLIARRRGYPSDKSLIEFLNNHEDQLGISAHEVRRAAIILDPEQAVVKGKFGYKRAIYGCQQSGLLWYNTLIGYLVEQGFKTSDYDSCLLRKEGMLVGMYVDDLLLMSEPDKDIQDFKDNISRKRFGGITFNEGETLIYLGMRIRTSEIGISCDICEYTARIIEVFGDRG